MLNRGRMARSWASRWHGVDSAVSQIHCGVGRVYDLLRNRDGAADAVDWTTIDDEYVDRDGELVDVAFHSHFFGRTVGDGLDGDWSERHLDYWMYAVPRYCFGKNCLYANC